MQFAKATKRLEKPVVVHFFVRFIVSMFLLSPYNKRHVYIGTGLEKLKSHRLLNKSETPECCIHGGIQQYTNKMFKKDGHLGLGFLLASQEI